MSEPLPRRKHPVHMRPIERHNQPTILLVTVCSKDRKLILANKKTHDTLCEIWRSCRDWNVGFHVVMPDHVHLFCAPATWPIRSLRRWVTYWKSRVTASLDMTRGTLWQSDFWDTQMRSYDHYEEKVSYIRMNPVRKGIVACPEEWKFQGTLTDFRW